YRFLFQHSEYVPCARILALIPAPETAFEPDANFFRRRPGLEDFVQVLAEDDADATLPAVAALPLTGGEQRLGKPLPDGQVSPLLRTQLLARRRAGEDRQGLSNWIIQRHARCAVSQKVSEPVGFEDAADSPCPRRHRMFRAFVQGPVAALPAF